MSFLANVEWANFKKLIEVTQASKGNLSVQITKLQGAGYIKVRKSFQNNYPLTECRITPKGREALEKYVSDIKKLLNI